MHASSVLNCMHCHCARDDPPASHPVRRRHLLQRTRRARPVTDRHRALPPARRARAAAPCTPRAARGIHDHRREGSGGVSDAQAAAAPRLHTPRLPRARSRAAPDAPRRPALAAPPPFCSLFHRAHGHHHLFPTLASRGRRRRRQPVLPRRRLRACVDLPGEAAMAPGPHTQPAAAATSSSRASTTSLAATGALLGLPAAGRGRLRRRTSAHTSPPWPPALLWQDVRLLDPAADPPLRSQYPWSLTGGPQHILRRDCEVRGRAFGGRCPLPGGAGWAGAGGTPWWQQQRQRCLPTEARRTLGGRRCVARAPRAR